MTSGIRYFVVDAFADQIFSGNPAGVCVLPYWPETELMQNIAQENNLSETAFVVGRGPDYKLRWFTPGTEIELCGHATLATAFILRSFYGADQHEVINFNTLSGLLSVEAKGELLEMNFPARPQTPVEVSPTMKKAVGGPVVGAYGGYNLTLELNDEESVREMIPDLAAVRELSDYHGLIVTAQGESCDFVSRFFAPNLGVDEDPVTGSSHTSLIPFWAEQLGKTEMVARQLSDRGGTIYCRQGGDRVFIAGQARLYLTGEIQVD